MKLFLEKFKFILIDNSRKIPYIYCLIYALWGQFQKFGWEYPWVLEWVIHYNTNIENKS